MDFRVNAHDNGRRNRWMLRMSETETIGNVRSVKVRNGNRLKEGRNGRREFN